MPAKLTRTSLADESAKEIRKMILNGTLKPGDRVNEVHIAKQLQVSRGPIREALLMLQNEGLVTHEVNKGTAVSILSTQDAYEIYTFRALLEAEAVQLGMANMKEEHLTMLELIIKKFKYALDTSDMEGIVACDIEFHRVIVSMCNHSRLIQAHNQLDSQVGAMFLTISNQVPMRVNRVVEIHQLLLDVLKSKDIERISSELRLHYLLALKQLESKGR